MDATRLKFYQEKLSQRRAAILAAVHHLEAEDRELSGKKHLDWLDQAWDENELRLLERLEEGYETELEKIETALEKTASGKYGLCSACHEPIEEGRLDASPETEFCQACQELREKFAKAS